MIKASFQSELLCPFLQFSDTYYIHKNTTDRRYRYSSSIFLIEAGRGMMETENKMFELYPGQLIYVPPWLAYRFTLDEGSAIRMRYAYFDWKFMERPLLASRREHVFIDNEDDSPVREEYIGSSGPLKQVVSIQVEKLTFWLGLYEPFSHGYDFIIHHQTASSLLIQSHFQVFLHHFLSKLVQNNHFIDPRIQKIIDRMDQMDHPEEFQGVEDWAEEAGLTRTYFQTLFKQQTSFTPKAYWNRCRMLKVIEELIHTDISITDLVNKYRFSSLHYFSKQFHRLTGDSPSNYRRKNAIL